MAVRAESFAGPLADRTALSLAAGGGRIHLGTDRGLYGIEGEPLTGRFRPEHGGFTDDQGRESVGAVDRMALDPTGRRLLLVSRFGGADFLTASEDGGETFRPLSLPSPNPLLEVVDGLYAFPPSDDAPDGAFAVAQGPSLYRRQGAETAAWERVQLPFEPVEWGVGFADGSGTVLVGVEGPEGVALLDSRDGGRSFRMVETGSGPYLAVAWYEGSWSRVDADVWRHGLQGLRWDGHWFVAARLQVLEGRLRWAVVGESMGSGLLSVATGTGLPDQIDGVALLDDVVLSTLSLVPGGAVIAAPDGDLIVVGESGWIRRRSFDGGEMDLGSLAVHTATQRLYVGHRRTGEIYRGRAEDPASMVARGTPLFQSESRCLLVDPQLGESIFAGSFGVHYNDGSSVVWEQRNTGQFSYLQENFSGPVKPRTLDISPDGVLWLGAIQGDGPYRGLDTGQSWQPVHGGLGPHGSREGEDGLPFATSINAFAFPEDAVWMASFRGGVWRLDASTGATWLAENRGLPDLSGTVVDSCCFDTTAREIDARDLVVTEAQTLLVATAWGAYRREAGARQWESSSLGLANSDLRALAVSPDDPSRVVAVARSGPELGAWLFYSEDSGRTWTTVGSSLVAKTGVDVVWSRPQSDEIVALLENQGAWRLELDP